MGFSQSWFALVFLIAAASVLHVLAATTHIVGGDQGWTIPGNTSVYSDWAATQNFTVGDSLVFNFTTGNHNVAHVSKAEYDACTSQKPIGTIIQTGPATVVLDTAGEYYFICTFDTHCSSGQKLAIDVVTATGSEAPTTSIPAPAPAPPPPPPSSATGLASVEAFFFSLFSLVFSYFLYV